MTSQVQDLTAAQVTLLKQTVTARLKEIDPLSDESLTEYVLVLLANRHSQEKVMQELEDFLSPMVVEDFVNWLFGKFTEIRSSMNTLPAAMPMSVPAPVHAQQRMDVDMQQQAPQRRQEQVTTATERAEDAESRLRARAQRFGIPASSSSRSKSPLSRQVNQGSNRRGTRSRSPVRYRSISQRLGGELDSTSTEDRRRDRHRDERRDERRGRSDRRHVEESRDFVDARELLSKPRGGKVRNNFDDEDRGRERNYERGVRRFTDEPDYPGRSEKRSARMEDNIEKSQKDELKRCSYWPNCKSGEDCPFVHPSEPCKHFPNCMFGETCLFIHPVIPCKFQDRCTNANCNYQHLSPAQLATGKFSTVNPFQPPTNIQCKFFPNCKNTSCPFLHPTQTPCHLGEACQRPTCPCSHPPGRVLASKALVKAPCRYGNYCAKQDCPFQHTTNDEMTDVVTSLPAEPTTTPMDSQVIPTSIAVPVAPEATSSFFPQNL